jgi:hypothetical protein
VTIAFDAAVPPPGATITGCGADNHGCPPINLGLRLRASSRITNLVLVASLNNPQHTCLVAERTGISLNPNEDTPIGLVLTGQGGGLNDCATPFPTNALNVFAGESFQAFSLDYSFER